MVKDTEIAGKGQGGDFAAKTKVLINSYVCALCRRRAAGYSPPEIGDRYCHSPEHYVSMVLAYWQVDNQTECDSVITWKSWAHSSRPGHPGEFGPTNVTQQLILQARDPGRGCKSDMAIR